MRRTIRTAGFRVCSQQAGEKYRGFEIIAKDECAAEKKRRITGRKRQSGGREFLVLTDADGDLRAAEQRRGAEEPAGYRRISLFGILKQETLERTATVS
jgi:hypothetical protein